MATVKLDGKPFRTAGELPKVGGVAPAFTLTAHDLSDTSLADYRGRKVVLNIFPSVETGVCAAAARRFNEIASSRPDVAVLCVSADLPFTAKRFCAAQGLQSVTTLSTFRHREFGQAYGVLSLDGAFAGLMSRAVVVIDEKGRVVHTEQVPEIGQEPDYDALLAAL